MIENIPLGRGQLALENDPDFLELTDLGRLATLYVPSSRLLVDGTMHEQLTIKRVT